MKRHIWATVRCLSVSLCAITANQSAFAQASGADKAASYDGVEDIVVTARRTAENLQNVPVAVTVISGESLDRQRVTSGRDLQFITPSLVVTNEPLGGSTTPVFQLRGQAPAQGSDDTVVTYVGDVPISSRAFAGGLFDLQSVQVLRGPQGTLFGKNSTGGAVIFTPRLADPGSVSGFVDGTVGNYSLFQIGAGVNMPLIPDKLAVRVSGQITRQDGFVRNISGPDGFDKHYELARVSLVATPTDELRNETFFNYYHGRNRQIPLIMTGYNRTLVTAIIGATNANIVQQQFDQQQLLGPRKINYSFRSSADNNIDYNDVYIVTNTTSYDFGSVTLKNIFGYTKLSPRVTLAQTSTNFPIVDVLQSKDLTSISDELQLSGNTGSLKWIVGGFLSRDKTSTRQQATNFGSLRVQTRSTDRYTSRALFGQGTYEVLNGLKFTAGLRHTWDTRKGVLSSDNFTGGVFIPAFSITPDSKKFASWSWTLGLDYQVSPDLLLYAVSRHSYKAGGFNLVSNTVPPELVSYEPEKLTDVEIGVKSTLRLGEARIRTNLAVYRGWYKNMHFQQRANCGGSVASFVVNAAKGSPKGLELEVDASVTRNFRVGGFYNRTLGKFAKFQLVPATGCVVSGAGINLTGTDFGNIAKNTAGMNASYTLPLTAADEAFVLSGNWYHRSRRVGSVTAGSNAAFGGYSLFNARLDYNNIGGSRFSAGAWVRNIGDKLYTTFRNNSLVAGYDARTYGEPRTFGLDVKYRF